MDACRTAHSSTGPSKAQFDRKITVMTQRITDGSQLMPGMAITLCSAIYGNDNYIVDCKPSEWYTGEFIVVLTHAGSHTPHVYTLSELGISRKNNLRWVEKSS